MARPPQHRRTAGTGGPRGRARPLSADRATACRLAWRLVGLWLGASDLLAWLVVFLLLQVLRVWVLMTLGRRWTTRIIVLPSAPLVTPVPTAFCRIRTILS